MTKPANERVVMIGRSQSLVGILASPARPAGTVLPGVVILNTGIAHRVGHHRMYVGLARKLAGAGHAVLRFDLSGIGDSPARADGMAPLPAVLAEIREAVDWITAKAGARTVVLVGLCQGAEHALRYGHADPRVVGLVLLDPPVPPTARFYAHYVGQRLLSPRSWLTFGTGRGRLWRDATAGLASLVGAGAPEPRDSLLEPRNRGLLEELYRRSIAAGLHLLTVLAGEEQNGRQTYREQLLDAFPGIAFGSRLRLEFFDDCDHTFGSLRHRRLLGEVVLDWLAQASLERPSAVAAGEDAGPGVARGD